MMIIYQTIIFSAENILNCFKIQIKQNCGSFYFKKAFFLKKIVLKKVFVHENCMLYIFSFFPIFSISDLFLC